jgi:hypothetical protein
MFTGRASGFWAIALVTALAIPAASQSVISTHAGTVLFFEGAVSIGDQPLELHPGKFSNIPQGAELRTAEGRAEIQLTPVVFLRLGDRSAVRMVANDLSDTRVELLAGSAIVDSGEPVPGTSVTLIYRNWRVHFLEQGVYRIDSNPPRMWVLDGKAEVSGNDARAILVEQGACLPFAQVLVPDRAINPPLDALSKWQDGRQQSIAADNAIAANIQDPASLDNPDNSASATGGFTYFPPLWLPPAGLTMSGLYGYQDPYQPGFNSIYLPGYSYLPLFFEITRIGNPPVRSSTLSGVYKPTRPPIRVWIPARSMPLAPTPMGATHGMATPMRAISAPPPVHAAPSAGVHASAHR